MSKRNLLKWGFACVAVIVAIMAAWGYFARDEKEPTDYLRSVYDPIHFKPAIETATNQQCLTCHQEILTSKVLAQSEAGVKTTDAIAWYQRLSTYTGPQDTFHRRHLVTEYSNQVMSLKCTTCHQGNEPRDEAPGTSATAIPQGSNDVKLRKHVNPDICLMCHGQFPYQTMALPGPWHEIKDMMGNNCMTCHASIRTNRHQVNYLKAAEIEKLGTENADVCYGCHGGRPWYRIAFPYPRHAWEGMPEETPDWAKNRPNQSEARFQKSVAK